MGDIEVDAELLISLVADRAVLWDKSLEGYKSRTESSAAWREVFVELNPGFNTINPEEMNKYGKAVITKWTNIRDRQVKYLKKLSEGKRTGSQAKSIKKYVYSDQLAFLKKNSLPKETVSSHGGEKSEVAGIEETDIREDNSENENDGGKAFRRPSSPASIRKRKRGQSGMTDVEVTILNKLQEPEDRHLNFFKGILPSLHNLNDAETVKFQIGVLNILQTIQQSRTPVISASCSVNQPPINYSGPQGMVTPIATGHDSRFEQPRFLQHNPSPNPSNVSSPLAGSSHSPASQNSTPSHQSSDSVGAFWDLS